MPFTERLPNINPDRPAPIEDLELATVGQRLMDIFEGIIYGTLRYQIVESDAERELREAYCKEKRDALLSRYGYDADVQAAGQRPGEAG